MGELRIGIDTSSSNTAIVVTKNGLIIDHLLISPKNKSLDSRVFTICETVDSFLSGFIITNGIDITINIEGIAFGAVGKVVDLAMLVGFITMSARLHGFTVNLIAPTTLKKSFTGSGRASKDDMIATCRDKYPIAFNVFKGYKKIDDLVDAFALAIHEK